MEKIKVTIWIDPKTDKDLSPKEFIIKYFNTLEDAKRYIKEIFPISENDFKDYCCNDDLKDKDDEILFMGNHYNSEYKTINYTSLGNITIK